MERDPRLEALYSPWGEEIFSSVTHRHQIWLPDPFDVEEIHSEARDLYWRLSNRVRASRPVSAGRILLLLGDSGAGKTHLMRALRNSTHEQAHGFFAYMQMTSMVTNYARYVLRQTIDSLDKPHYAPHGPSTSLLRLSNALIENENIPVSTINVLRNAKLSVSKLTDPIARVANHIVKLERFHQVDLDLVRAMLFLQMNNPAIHNRVFRFLRCEPLAPQDQQVFGGLLAPRTEEDDPQRMITALAHLIQALDAGSLVLCLDQLEDLQQMDAAERKFRNAMQAMIAFAEIPNVIVVIACLADFYTELRGHLTHSHLDRIENDPAPVKLTAERSAEEAKRLISRRLIACFEEQEIDYDEREPLFPFPPDTATKLAGMPTRKILDWCRNQRENGWHGISTVADLPSLHPPPIPPLDESAEIQRLNQDWNDHLTNTHPVPEHSDALLRLLAMTLQDCIRELPDHACTVVTEDEALDITMTDTTGVVEQRLWVAMCEKPAPGGGLEKQMNTLTQRAGQRIPVAVRSTEFPSSPKTQIAQRLGRFVAEGGRRVVVTNSDWRAMVAMQSFHVEHSANPTFSDWRRVEHPLMRLPSLQQLFALEDLKPVNPPPHETLTKPLILPSNAHADFPVTPQLMPLLRIGQTRDSRAQPVTVDPALLVRHAAFLGGSGSGKTTLALHLLEQLLMRGIPALLIDRKGDLSRYAKPEAWRTPLTDIGQGTARDALFERIEVALYTPGALEGQGRPLRISIVPPGLGELPSGEREQLAKFGAMALGGIMNYKMHGQDLQRIAILGRAIEVLAELNPNTAPSLEDLIEFIDSEDPRLLNAIGKLETRHFRKLVSDLQTLSIINGGLFRGDQEALDIATLFGREPNHPSQRTRLTIINTIFLGNNANVLFWVAQLLLELGRYATRHPSDTLQAVILFDEADHYLPAQSKPATKEPLENLLRRARAAGIGLLLSTQSPGDLDYRSRDQISSWFLGRIKENTAINKLKPMLNEAKTDVTGKIPHQIPGEFYFIRDGEVTSLKGDLSLIHVSQVPAEEILALAGRGRGVLQV